MSEKVAKKVMAHLKSEGGKDKEKGGKKLHTHRIEVERADHGGHHIRHHMRDEDGNDAGVQTGIAANNDDMGAQVQDAMADQPPAGQGAPPTTAPDPAGAGGDPGAMGQ
jgi:hypothetical protein